MRTSSERWMAIRSLVGDLDRVVRGAAYLDALSVATQDRRLSEAASVDRDVRRLAHRVERELDTLTCEWLAADHYQTVKRRREGRKPA